MRWSRGASSSRRTRWTRRTWTSDLQRVACDLAESEAGGDREQQREVEGDARLAAQCDLAGQPRRKKREGRRGAGEERPERDVAGALRAPRRLGAHPEQSGARDQREADLRERGVSAYVEETN